MGCAGARRMPMKAAGRSGAQQNAAEQTTGVGCLKASQRASERVSVRRVVERNESWKAPTHRAGRELGGCRGGPSKSASKGVGRGQQRERAEETTGVTRGGGCRGEASKRGVADGKLGRSPKHKGPSRACMSQGERQRRARRGAACRAALKPCGASRRGRSRRGAGPAQATRSAPPAQRPPPARCL